MKAAWWMPLISWQSCSNVNMYQYQRFEGSWSGCGISVYFKCGNPFCSQVKGNPCLVPRDQPDTYTAQSHGITKVGKDIHVQLSTYHHHCPLTTSLHVSWTQQATLCFSKGTLRPAEFRRDRVGLCTSLCQDASVLQARALQDTVRLHWQHWGDGLGSFHVTMHPVPRLALPLFHKNQSKHLKVSYFPQEINCWPKNTL